MKYSQNHLARKIAVQSIYTWQISRNNIETIQRDYLELNKNIKLNKDYYLNLTKGVLLNLQEIDEKIKLFINIEPRMLGIIEQAILRVSLYELIHESLTHKIVINEAIEIAKIFGSDESYKFINGVLDKYVTSTSRPLVNHG